MAALKHHSIGWGSCFFSKLRQKHCASTDATGCWRPRKFVASQAQPTARPSRRDMNSNTDQNCPTNPQGAQTNANGNATAPTVNDKNCGK
ncbi:MULTISPECIES: hypothetical protein [unclassified Mesorhizobium]|uniref:hypothetical protein n=1 Tax=unclassified Mesorhizobium TaxID=325217 RepID=UPI001ABF002E|nr:MULTISPECIES: hypothetical protein [unclassified Mesorhizobium]